MEPTTTGWLASWGQGGKLGRGEGALSFCYFGCSGDESLYLFLFSSGRGRLPCIEGIYKGEAMANAQVNYLAHVDTGEGRGVGGKRGGGGHKMSSDAMATTATIRTHNRVFSGTANNTQINSKSHIPKCIFNQGDLTGVATNSIHLCRTGKAHINSSARRMDFTETTPGTRSPERSRVQ